MNKLTITHIILLPIIFVGSVISVYLPKPFELIIIILFIVSFVTLIGIGFLAAIRNESFFQMFHPNPFKQIEASASTNFNRVEKTITIYALVVIFAIIFAMIFTPILGPIMQNLL